MALTLTKSQALVVSSVLLGLLVALTFAMWLLPLRNASPFARSTMPAPHKVSIIAFGDQGSGDFRQRRVAALMESACRKMPNLAFIQTLGDNFYSRGVKTLHDPLWNTAFQSIYNTPCLADTVFHASLGNHDEAGNPAVQIAYTRHDPGPVTWYMPDYYYVSHAGSAGDGRPLVTVMVIDSGMPLDRQIALMDKTFANPHAAVWRIVAGHHNVRTDSVKYHNDRRLARALLPALMRNHVDFYLSGHSHNLQLIEHPGEPVYVIAGGGGKRPRPVLTTPSNNTLMARRALGFAALTFDESSATIAFTATSGRLFSTLTAQHYQFQVSRECLDAPRREACVRPL